MEVSPNCSKMESLNMDLQIRMKELEEEVEAERSIRARGKQALRSSLSLVQQQNKLLKEQLEKTKQRLQEAKTSSCSQSQIEGWKKESRQHDRELFKLKTGHEEHLEELEALRTEKKTFQDEIAVLKDKLSDVNESVCELHKVLRKLEKEKEKLQTSLGKSDAAFEQVIENLQSEAEKVNLLIKEKKELQRQAKDLENQLEQERERNKKSNKKSLDKMEQMKSFLEDLLMSNDMELLELTISKLDSLKTKQQLMNQQIHVKELDWEQKQHTDTAKTLHKNEQGPNELLFQSKEDHKNQQRMHELVERLKNKMKAYKRRAEEAEEQASVNLAKYRNTTQELDDAKEWIGIAKLALSNININN